MGEVGRTERRGAIDAIKRPKEREKRNSNNCYISGFMQEPS